MNSHRNRHIAGRSVGRPDPTGFVLEISDLLMDIQARLHDTQGRLFEMQSAMRQRGAA